MKNLRPTTTPPPPAPSSLATTLLSACDLVPLGDGSYKAIPRKPKGKVTIKEAAHLARYSRATMYRLFNAGFVDGERQSPRRILIDVDSLQTHLRAVRDPEFWTRERRLRYYGV